MKGSPRRIPRPGRRQSTPPRGDLQVKIGRRLRELRTTRKISQADLGRPYYTRAQVSAAELGKILPSLVALQHFAQRLEVPVRDLMPE